jgi:hypothetical protein
MSRRLTLALAALVIGAAPVTAQVRFPTRPATPSAWASLSIGLFQLQDIYDPDSDSFWDFGNIVQFRGSLERSLRRGWSAGIAGTLARAPLSYSGPDCDLPSCDADAMVWQALALLRIGGGGVGLHQVIELAAGVTGFSGFDRRDGAGDIGPSTVIDPTFKIGYGLGVPLAANMEFTLLQEVGLMIHERGDRPAGDESNVPRTYATRIGLRFGLGGRR